MLRIALVASLCALTVASAASATTSGYRWSTTKAQNRVKATYRTPDTAYPSAPDAVVATATCVGVGKPVNYRYSKFHCTATMRGAGEYAGDGFHATHKLTITVTGSLTFTWVRGWR